MCADFINLKTKFKTINLLDVNNVKRLLKK